MPPPAMKSPVLLALEDWIAAEGSWTAESSFAKPSVSSRVLGPNLSHRLTQQPPRHQGYFCCF